MSSEAGVSPGAMLTALREHGGTVTNQELPRHSQRFSISPERPNGAPDLAAATKQILSFLFAHKPDWIGLLGIFSIYP